MIRPATMLDLPWLRQLHASFVKEFDAPYPRTDNEELDHFVLAVSQAIKDPSFCLFVADDEQGKIVGYIGAGIMRRPVGKPKMVATPYWLYVVPEHRGQGVSRALAAHGIAWLREHWPQVDTIEVPARAGDEQWQKRGFEPFLVFHHGPLSLADQYVLGRPRSVPNGQDHDSEFHEVVEAK